MLLAALLTLLVAALVVPASSGPAAAETAPVGRVVVIGVPGLRWADLDPERTPALWALADRGSTASLSTRAVPPEGLPVTCPAAGWLTVSAGQRAASPGPGCGAIPAPVAAGDGGTASVPGWPALVAAQQSSPFRARLGLLADAVTAAGGEVAAIGPGAALAAADGSGRVAAYAATPAALPDLAPYALVVAEAGEITRAWTGDGQVSPPAAQSTAFPARAAPSTTQATPPAAPSTTQPARPTASAPESTAFPARAAPSTTTAGAEREPADLDGAARREAVSAADRTVGEVLSKVPQGATVLVAGISDSGSVAHLHVAIASGGPYGRGWLTAASTRQRALVTITDITATVTHLLGIPTPEGVVGRAWSGGGAAPSAAEAARGLTDADLASQVLREVREPFFIALVSAQLLFYALAAIVVRRHRRMLTATRVVATVSAALPVSIFLAQLVPWWSLRHPMPALLGTIVAFAALVAGLAYAGPWRGRVLGPPAVVAGVSSLALLADVLTGSRLQVNAVAGYEPVTGGRFYGFGNMAFAVYSTGTILLLAAVAHALRRRPRLAVAVCVAYGLLAIAGDGWPTWGADFGGVPSFVLGVAVCVLMTAGRRVSVLRLGVIGLAGAALISLIAVADWLRPADQRTHLGAFVQQIIGGDGGSVVGRKLGAMLHTLGNLPLTLLSVVALAFLFLVLARPSRWGAAALSLAYAQAPELRAGLIGALTAAFAGFLINDSGIAIPAMALTVAVPLALAASVHALQLAPPTTAARSSAPAEATAPPTA
ncbi:hypothetical protein DI270_031650 [Microbispora triticiradicis]|uniref:MFS transporter n=1 Tax=Microbispora triticiradicis TaxID=2200763 RepID=A0ABX9LAP4_9ACTN|nr:hypothetical protein [Microbispora triticiradicis]RGA01032.1 hypothetical protein DI270_031650 [Microbispora triticiradicis]GLW23946.1 hypothetical protein Mame01_39890 [Microbispora amethystogenes]